MKLVPQLWDVPRVSAQAGLGASRREPGAWRGLGWLCAALLLGLVACGYEPVYGAAGGRRYDVVAGRSTTSSFEAVQVTLGGVRRELGAAQALGGAFPRVVVELLRVDDRSIGVRASASGAPLARGTEVVVVGRARVEERAGEAPSLDTGDMSRAAQFSAGSSPAADAAARSRAIRDAAGRLGEALGRRLLGMPEPSEG